MIRKETAKILVIMLLLTAMLTGCSKDSEVGFWVVEKVTAGDVVMTQSDAENLGFSSVGSIKLQKSGNCEVVLLGEESTGTWERTSDGKITVNYGDDHQLTGNIDSEGRLILCDPQGSEYILKK